MKLNLDLDAIDFSTLALINLEGEHEEELLSALIARARDAERLEELVEDYEQVLQSKRDNTRALDVAMHGEDGATKQASICDLIPLAERLRARAETAEAEAARRRADVEKLTKALEPFGDVSGEGDEDFGDDEITVIRFGRTTAFSVTLGNFRTAARLLAETAPSEQEGRAG